MFVAVASGCYTSPTVVLVPTIIVVDRQPSQAPGAVTKIAPVCSIAGCNSADASCEAALYQDVLKRIKTQAKYVTVSSKMLMRFATNQYALRVVMPAGKAAAFDLDWDAVGCIWTGPPTTPGDDAKRRLCPVEMSRWTAIANSSGPQNLALDQQYRTVCLGIP